MRPKSTSASSPGSHSAIRTVTRPRAPKPQCFTAKRWSELWGTSTPSRRNNSCTLLTRRPPLLVRTGLQPLLDPLPVRQEPLSTSPGSGPGQRAMTDAAGTSGGSSTPASTRPQGRRNVALHRLRSWPSPGPPPTCSRPAQSDGARSTPPRWRPLDSSFSRTSSMRGLRCAKMSGVSRAEDGAARENLCSYLGQARENLTRSGGAS